MPNETPIRAGYPIDRDTSNLGPITKKHPCGRRLKRYKINARGKFLVLHATRGWRVL